jgi:hypothetical protein
VPVRKNKNIAIKIGTDAKEPIFFVLLDSTVLHFSLSNM